MSCGTDINVIVDAFLSTNNQTITTNLQNQKKTFSTRIRWTELNINDIKTVNQWIVNTLKGLFEDLTNENKLEYLNFCRHLTEQNIQYIKTNY